MSATEIALDRAVRRKRGQFALEAYFEVAVAANFGGKLDELKDILRTAEHRRLR